MAVDIILIQTCLLHCLARGQIGILCLLGHHLTLVTTQKRLKIGLGHIAADGREKTCILTLLTEDDAATAFVKRLTDGIECGSQARPDAHSRHHDSISHV